MPTVREKNFPYDFMKIAVEEYKKFRGRDEWDEQYKWDILSVLNKEFPKGGITKENIVEKVELLQKMNPAKGSFVHWSELDRLKTVAQKEPDVAVHYINLLIDEDRPLSKRVDNARREIRERFDGNFGTPLIGYILAATNMKNYPLYKDEIFKHFQSVIGLDLGHIDSIGKKYEKYIEVCNLVSEYLKKEGIIDNPDIMYGQDFLYCISRYDSLKYKIYIKYLYMFSRQLKKFEDDPTLLLEAITKLDRDFLGIEKEKYRNGEKVRKIRYDLIEKILDNGHISYEEFRDIKENVLHDYRDKNVLKVWNDFRILFQIYFDRYKEKINYMLKSIYSLIRRHELFKEERFAEGKVINDFLWNNNFGTTSCWVSLFPSSRKTHKRSAQIFIMISPKGIEYGLYIGNDLKIDEKNNIDIISDPNEFEISKMFSKFEEVYPDYKRINELISMENKVNYWKISPGENAWNWDACRDGGFIAIGWDELGDVSNMSREEFDTIKKKLAEKYEDYTEYGMEQVWKFSHNIKKDDYIVANKGTTEVLGIGVVTGPYVFVEGIHHGHHLPVKWVDLTRRKVNEPGWRRTIIQLDKKKFEEIKKANPVEKNWIAPPFSNIFMNKKEAEWAFDLMKETIDNLGISSPDDKRLSITITDNDKTLRLNFCNWAILHFKSEDSENRWIGMALFDNQIYLGEYTRKWDPFADTEKDIRVTEIPMEKAMPLKPELHELYRETLDHISQRFKNWVASNYRRFNQPEITEAIFYPEKREKLLIDGVKKIQYFWVTANPKIWKVNGIKNTGEVFYNAYSGDGGKKRVFEAFEKAKPGDKVIFYEATPTKKIVAEGEITKPLHLEKDEGVTSPVLGISISYKKLLNKIAWEKILSMPQLQNAKPVVNNARGSIFELTKEEYEAIIKLSSDAANGEINPRYTLEKCSYETGFDVGVLRRYLRAIERKRQIIFYGPPGTSKTYLARHLAKHITGGTDGIWEIVQFHPAYAYEDFIQGIRPQLEKGQLKYDMVPGKFLKFIEKASKRNGKCVLIIDEINRANLARVFGELMYLLEYRNEKISLAGGGNLEIPDNVRVIGTMNTADRSIALVDHALRRRFAFIPLWPDYNILRKYHENNNTGFNVEPLIEVLKKLNTQIGDRHYEIGQAFFMRRDISEQIEDIWRMEIEPYLEEYFFDQPEKTNEFRWEKVKSDILPEKL